MRCQRQARWQMISSRYASPKDPATRNRARDHLIVAAIYSQMLYQLSYSQLCANLRRFTFKGGYLLFQNSRFGS